MEDQVLWDPSFTMDGIPRLKNSMKKRWIQRQEHLKEARIFSQRKLLQNLFLNPIKSGWSIKKTQTQKPNQRKKHNFRCRDEKKTQTYFSKLKKKTPKTSKTDTQLSAAASQQETNNKTTETNTEKKKKNSLKCKRSIWFKNSPQEKKTHKCVSLCVMPAVTTDVWKYRKDAYFKQESTKRRPLNKNPEIL